MRPAMAKATIIYEAARFPVSGQGSGEKGEAGCWCCKFRVYGAAGGEHEEWRPGEWKLVFIQANITIALA